MTLSVSSGCSVFPYICSYDKPDQPSKYEVIAGSLDLPHPHLAGVPGRALVIALRVQGVENRTGRCNPRLGHFPKRTPNGPGSMNSNSTEPDWKDQTKNPRDLGVQVVISVALGLTAFLAFCVSKSSLTTFEKWLSLPDPQTEMDCALCGTQTAARCGFEAA